ncbi:MAG: phosphoglycerate kinase [Bacteroidales bacterium]|jgi:phosphoglycerate kinase|nr:phosphoglycerate kinase [Bacteroidales bacterium]
MTSINDINFKGKKVLIRVDFNVPLDKNKQITDDSRIVESLPTIKKLIADGGKVIMMAHFGRPKQGGFEEDYSLKPIVGYVEKMLGKKVAFTQKLLFDNEVLDMINSLQDGDVMLLENIRFYPQETKGDVDFAEKIAALGDCYINDAFAASHRNHVSTCTLAHFFPNHRYFGYLMEHEVTNLQRLMRNAGRPFTSVIGGAKISSKINILESLIDKSDNILIGGGMVFTFLKAQQKTIGSSLCEDDCIEEAKRIMEKAKAKNVSLLLPVDVVIADRFANDANRKTVSADDIPSDWMGMDIGEKTSALYQDVIMKSQTILWNGPMGVFEMDNFATGTKNVALAVADATDKGAFSTIGGGDSVAAIHLFNLGERVSYVSTGGGAMLEYIEQGTLPGIDAILK